MVACISGPTIHISDDDLIRISAENPGWHFERADDGSLLVSPTATTAGAKSGEAFVQLHAYAKRAGGKAYDAATGFATPAGGVVSPDAAWIRSEVIDRFREQNGYWPVVPDVVIEVASKSDSWTALVRKIDKYIADGARYAIAIDPATRTTYERGTCPAGLELDIDAIAEA